MIKEIRKKRQEDILVGCLLSTWRDVTFTYGHFPGMGWGKCCWCFPSSPCDQVAGRLHVEVVRVGGGLEDNMAGGDEPDNNQDEIQDRKLVCMVRWIDHQRS